MATTISSFQGFMTMQNNNDRQFVAHYSMPSSGKSDSGTVGGQLSARSESPTEYAFIMNTGNKSPAAARQDLREVRSHVMKVHLRRQQQKGRGPSEGLLSASADRRKGKQRVRSSRSASRDSEDTISENIFSQPSYPSRKGIGMVFPGFSTLSPFQLGQIGFEMQSVQSSFRPDPDKQQFALDFGWSPTPPDEVSTAAELYIASSIRDRMNGHLEPSLETLNQKGEAVRIVMEILSMQGNHVSQSVVMAVSLLAVGCALENDVDQVQHHLGALERIVQARGGVETLDFDLQRIFTWNVHCVSAALQLPPRFPCPVFNQMEPLPLAFLDDARIRAWRTIKRLPKNSSFLFDTVLRLHQVGLGTSEDWYDEVDQRALSNVYFEALHNVAAIQFEEAWNATVTSGPQGREMALMYRVFAIGMAVFIWGSIRQARKRFGLAVTQYTCDPVFMRLRGLLEGPGRYHAWPRGKSLEPVLATLMYCVESCDYHDAWRGWLMDALRTAVDMMKIKNVEEFRKILNAYPSTDGYKEALDDMWAEIITGNMVATPNLMFSGPQ